MKEVYVPKNYEMHLYICNLKDSGVTDITIAYNLVFTRPCLLSLGEDSSSTATSCTAETAASTTALEIQ